MSCVIELTSRRWNLGHNPSEWVLLLKNVRYKHIHNDFKTHDNSSTNDAGMALISHSIRSLKQVSTRLWSMAITCLSLFRARYLRGYGITDWA